MRTKLFTLWGLLSQIPKKHGLLIIAMMLSGQILAVDDPDINSSQQQQITVTGTVTDEQGDPLPGTSIGIKGAQMAGIADASGKFSVVVPSENTVLVFSFIGFTPQEITVGRSRNLTVTMREDAASLEEVVVTGYTSQRRATMTGSVATMTNKDLVVTKNENVVNALAGKMPGLRISQKNSRPGDYNTTIDIRGYGTPLFVIDGVPRDQAYFSRMDSEEIESISVLKDGAGAVYGLRAANGVMLITTKRGNNMQGKVDISYTGDYTWQTFLMVPRSVTPTEWMTLTNEQSNRGFGYNNFFDLNSPVYVQSDFDKWEGREADNWMNAVFRDVTPQTKHSVSINGGSDRLSYFTNLGYSKQEGAFRSGSLWSDRWNFRSNIDSKLTERLKARISVSAILTTRHEPSDAGWTTYKNVWLQRPDATIYANNNPEYLNGEIPYINDGVNSIAQTTSEISGFNKDRSRRLSGSGTLIYDIPGVKGLSAEAFYDYSTTISDATTYRRPFAIYTYNVADDAYIPTWKGERDDQMAGRANRSATFAYSTNMQLRLRYSNMFGVHRVAGFTAFEENYTNSNNFSAQRYIIVNSEYMAFGEDDEQRGSAGTPSDRASKALIGEFSYDYSGKYIADFRFRYEGSSRWPKDNRWGFFPSVSLGWRISEEKFIKDNISFLSNLKFRASYGSMGDESDASNYPEIYSGFSGSNNYGWFFTPGSVTQGLSTTAIPNPNKTWYGIIMKNLAVDFGFLNNKFSGTFEVFQRDRTGLLATSAAVIPGTVGASLPQENLNDARQFGWEIDLTHRNRIGKVDYLLQGQFSATRGRRMYWLETPASHSYDHWRNRTSGRYTEIWWGREAEQMFTNVTDIRNYTAYPQPQGRLPGDWSFVDWNEDGIVDGSDDHPMATNGLATFNFGFSGGANYKGFDVNFHFQGAQGVYVQFSEVFTEALPFGGRNSMAWFMDRWRPTDPDADLFSPETQWTSGWYPYTGGDTRRTGTNARQNASYIRLKTLELGYTLPKAITSKVNIKSMRVYVNGYNLLTFSKLNGIDPERPGSSTGVGTSSNTVDMYQYPNNRTYTVGVNIKF